MKYLTQICLPGILLLCFGLFAVDLASAQRVSPRWQQRDSRMTNPTADIKASRPGDILVLLINEQSDVENKDNRTLQKQNAADSSASGNLAAGGFVGSATGNLNASEQSSATRSMIGNTQFKSEREFTDQFTVTVVDVLPNGNLLFSGTRNVRLEGDTKTLVVRGMVRKYDVSANNTISSRNVAGLDIRYEATDHGAEKSYINQGWLGKKFNKWWPH